MKPAGEGEAILVSVVERVKLISRAGNWPRIHADERESEWGLS